MGLLFGYLAIGLVMTIGLLADRWESIRPNPLELIILLTCSPFVWPSLMLLLHKDEELCL